LAEACIVTHPTTEPAQLEIRYAMEIRWARERGWIQIRDAFTGQWHELLADQVPPWWRRQAQMEKMRGLALGRRG
jgi:hypothetical protein